MAVALRLLLGLVSCAFAFSVCFQVVKGRLLLRYSLVWLFLSAVVLLCAVFPNGVAFLSKIVGVEAPSNFVFLIAVFIALAINLSLTMTVSKQQETIKNLVQEHSLLEKRFDDSRVLVSDENEDSVNQPTAR